MSDQSLRFAYLTVTFRNRDELIKTAESLRRSGVVADWIVVDGGSEYFDEAFVRLLSEIFPVARWSSSADSGIYDAFNRAMALLETAAAQVPQEQTYVNFLNSGDSVSSRFCVADFASHLAGCGMPAVCAGVSARVFGRRSWLWRPKRELGSVKWGMPFEHQAAYFRFDVVCGMRYDTRYSLSGDYDFISRIYQKCGGSEYATYRGTLCDFAVGGASYVRRLEAILEGALIRIRVHRMSYVRVYALVAYFVALHAIKRALLAVRNVRVRDA